MYKWFWVLIATALEVYADYFLKSWSINHVRTYAIAGCILYMVSGIGWGYLLKYETLQRAIVLFTTINVIAAMWVGHIIFNEQLNTKEIIATILALASIILLEI